MFWKKQPFPEIFFLLLVSAVVYLPHIGSLTYFKDDWYYVYDGMIAGPKIFHEMFRIDRPARGFFFEYYFTLFGPNPLPYHVGAFLWRGLSAIGALWIFNILWNRERRFAFLAALLFALYPGYFWWVSAIEYQPMIASLALQVFSIAFTLKSIEARTRIFKIAYLLGAILTGWGYIALVDYAIGMEVFRFLAVFVLVNRNSADSLRKKILTSFRALGWNLLIPLGFIFWRVFLFENQRQATDIGAQLGQFFGNPLSTGISWLLQTYNSLMNLAILAWIGQFPRYVLGMRLRDLAAAMAVAAFAVLLTALAARLVSMENDREVEPYSAAKDALLIGGVSMVLGILPVILANRYINLDSYSHYALPASLASALFLTGLIQSWSSRSIRNSMVYAVILFAALAHYGIATSALSEEGAIEKFWWQVNWRVPALRPGALLVIQYPSENIGDDGNGVVEAANVMYFRQPSAEIPVRYPLAALTLGDSVLRDVLSGSPNSESGYRSHSVNYDYGNILVLSQPTPTSCVHVQDGRRPLISQYDPGNMILAAPTSDIENVVTNAAPVLPQEFAFGGEPEHGWCYYYEKAELALQRGDWHQAVELGEEAIQLSLTPEDRSEWTPFLYANAITGNAEWLARNAKRVVGDKFLRQQTCDVLSSIQEPLNDEVKQVVDRDYCKKSE